MTNAPPPRESGSAPLARGASIGRYVVLSLVGRGGMGDVYAAYDPELDRKVAVKLLRVKPGNGVSLTEGRQRTLREAQAIARLSHPNVVVVFDVGTFEDKVFIAMEFVEGNTLAYWTEAQPRSWQEILKVFVAAGRGLEAAHEKGLVHRDFKPDNVMIGRDGKIRVMDFGLARQVSEKAPSDGVPRRIPVDMPLEAREVEVGSSPTIVIKASGERPETDAMHTSNSGLFDARLTRTGAMMGTPAYMAPEQFFNAPTDSRTDQFSFCIALYEALYGQRPFEGNNLSTLTGNVVRGSVREPPAGTKVPAWVRKIVLRGLRPVIGDRYPSMGDLLDALGKSPYAKRRGVAIAVGAAVLVVGFGFGVRQSLADRRAICGGGPEKLADIWELEGQGVAPGPGQAEPPHQAAIHAAFLRSGKSYAADVYATASRALTNYAQSWANMYKETCEATQVRHDQSADVLDLRMSCLQERLGGLRALTNVFNDANGDVVENAVNATNALATLDRCADVPLLRAVIRPPEDAATKAKVADLRRRLADLKARFDAGRWKEALNTAPALVKQTRAIGYEPLLAESLGLLGVVYSKASDSQSAEKTLVEAFAVADSARHDDVRAEAATMMVFVAGDQEAHFQEAQRWAQTADSVLSRIGGHELLHAWLLNNVGCMYDVHGDQKEAVHTLKESLALKEKVLGPDHPDVGLSEANLANSLQSMGKSEEALGHVDRAIALLKKGLGGEHPDLAPQISNRGEVLNALGRYPEARRSFEAARAIWERELGPDHPYMSYALTGIGLSFLGEGKASNAVAPLEQALKIRLAQKIEPTKRAETTFALAKALWESGQSHTRSRVLAEAARANYETVADISEAASVENWLQAHP